MKPRCLRELLSSPDPLGSDAVVLSRPHEFVLTLQAVIAVESIGSQIAAVDGRRYAAARLSGMPAVAKTAVGSPLLDVSKRVAEAVIGVPELQLAHPWRVEQHAAGWQAKELPCRRAVSTAIIGADGQRILHARPDQRVDER